LTKLWLILLPVVAPIAIAGRRATAGRLTQGFDA